ncbi:conserved hypothetical protein [Theileria equi strain WA]|uniref:Signal peptide containing protein n=1 Tax=Theileria equi strain WA TaxID=1537102 RepID=L1LE26_THEEQ|nr:conserved hypothetical protein [Theileria equi strain WA]EKX73408.1 conserved hypothetical protein [Theileria equi strain WA]|eukprot:XP_004832860.1 conserved hypothetical protein [Theileria equi strain WA]
MCKIFVIFALASLVAGKGQRYGNNSSTRDVSFAEKGDPLSTAMSILTRGMDGKKKENYGGGNIGAYYNFMFPENDDYPWACPCNPQDVILYNKKEQPYARCLNQEDLSFQDIQANCDPTNVTVNQEF